MTDLQKTTMMRQQKILGVLCILLPVLSVGFGFIGALRGVNYPGWYESISATYYANSRMMMIGLLCATGIYFWAYNGYDTWDNIITTISAVTSIFIVVFPCSDGRATTEPIVGLFCLPVELSGTIHTLSALILYSSFAIQVMRFRKRGVTVTNKKLLRNKIYLTCFILMCVGALFILSTNIIPALKPYHFFVFIGECFFQLAYGVAWLVKGQCVKYLNDD
ncbi:MAG: hypothetical protein MJ185_01480 [Treponema sp.]|nr:hypothetical protein [Treponema sp.]